MARQELSEESLERIKLAIKRRGLTPVQEADAVREIGEIVRYIEEQYQILHTAYDAKCLESTDRQERLIRLHNVNERLEQRVIDAEHEVRQMRRAREHASALH